MSNKTVALEELLKNSNFNHAEFEILSQNFRLLNPINTGVGIEKVDRQRFRDLLSEQFGITESLLMDRVMRVFDTDSDNHISFEEYIRGMSVFLKGKLEEKLKFCFKVYDLNSDRFIAKEEMFQLLQHCLVKSTDDDEDGVKDLVDLILRKLDEDRDGRVSEQDYASAVSKDALLLEAFGQCLPNSKHIDAYLQVTRPSVSDEERSSMHKVHEPRKGGMAAAGKDDKVPAMMESAKPVGVAK